MTFAPTTFPNLLDHCPPCDNLGYLFGDDFNRLHEHTKFAQSPLVNYFVPDRLWGSDFFADTDTAQRPTADETHPSGRAFPSVSDHVSSFLSLILDSTDNSGGQQIPWMLGPLFQLVPTILSSALLTPNDLPRPAPANERGTDKGKGKARAVDSDGTGKQGPEPAPVEDDTFADTLREVMAISRRADSAIRSPGEAGPSGNSTSILTPNAAPLPFGSASLPQIYSSGSGSGQAEIDHAILMSSIEHIENSLLTLRANFTFPTQIDCRMPSNADSHVSNPTDGDLDGYLTTYLPATPANSTVLNFVQDLRGLLLQLGHVDTKNDMEAESMKAKVAGVITGVLEDVESEVEEEIGKWMSLQATGTGVVGRWAVSDDLTVFG